MSEGSLCSWIAGAQLAPFGSQAFSTSAGTSLLAIGGLCEEEDLNDDGGHVGEKSRSRSDALKTSKDLSIHGSPVPISTSWFAGLLHDLEGTRNCALVEESVLKPRLQATTDQLLHRFMPKIAEPEWYASCLCALGNSELEHKEYETSRVRRKELDWQSIFVLVVVLTIESVAGEMFFLFFQFVGSNLLFKARPLAVLGDGQHLSGGSAVMAVLRWQRDAGNRVVSEPDGGAVLR
ncbi:unnamed protein product [Linum trigynum]|uniref:Uncharacterized protein n=1 Tax=Linum trigynum TaxID=586398 RepID=A0AAV2CS71_9ROSI